MLSIDISQTPTYTSPMLARCRRAYHRVLMLSRSIVDLASSDEIQPNHLAEALQYRVRHDYQIQALEGNKI